MKTRSSILIAIVLAAVTTGAARADQVLRMPKPPATVEMASDDYPVDDVGAIALARYAGARSYPTVSWSWSWAGGWGWSGWRRCGFRGWGSGGWGWSGWGRSGWRGWCGPRGYSFGYYPGGFTSFRWIH